MNEFLIFLNISIVFVAFFITTKKNNLQNSLFSIKHSLEMLQFEINNNRKYVTNKQYLLSDISNNYENYYESALQQLEKYDSSKNIEKETIKEKINKLIDEYNDNRIAAKKKLISRVSSNNSSSSNSSSSSSYDNSYSSYTDFSTSNSYSSNSSSDSSSSYSGDGGSFGGGGSGGDW